MDNYFWSPSQRGLSQSRPPRSSRTSTRGALRKNWSRSTPTSRRAARQRCATYARSPFRASISRLPKRRARSERHRPPPPGSSATRWCARGTWRPPNCPPNRPLSSLPLKLGSEILKCEKRHFAVVSDMFWNFIHRQIRPKTLLAIRPRSLVIKPRKNLQNIIPEF